MKTKKLEHPPYAHNWVRYVHPEIDSTTKALVRFAKGFPTTSYRAATPIIRDRIMFSLERETALKAASEGGRANSRDIVTEFVEAFYDYDEIRKYSGQPYFDEIVEPFRVGKGLSVPVKPLITIVEAGRLVPIFAVGWATFPLSRWQMRLLATIFEDAVFSLTDFRQSRGEFLCFPRTKDEAKSVREPMIWHRGDFDLLPKSELRDCLDTFLVALEKAKQILRELETETPSHKDENTADAPRLPLFPGIR